jgi:hypothetical protein
VSIVLGVVGFLGLGELDVGNVLVPVESHDVFVLLGVDVKGLTVVVEVGTRSLPGGQLITVRLTCDMELDRLGLKVGGGHDVESGGVLEWNDMSSADMKVEIIRLGGQSLGNSCSSASVSVEARVSSAKVHIEHVAPVSRAEVEVVGILAELVGQNRKLKS